MEFLQGQPISSSSSKDKSLHPRWRSGTKARRASWYHPGSVLNDRWVIPHPHSARHGGKAESITLVSRIQLGGEFSST